MAKLGLLTELKLGNLDAKRDWCYAKDAVYAMWIMLQQDQPDDYIIASGEVNSVRDLVQYAFDFVGLNWQDFVSVDPAFYRPMKPCSWWVRSIRFAMICNGSPSIPSNN